MDSKVKSEYSEVDLMSFPIEKNSTGITHKHETLDTVRENDKSIFGLDLHKEKGNKEVFKDLKYYGSANSVLENASLRVYNNDEEIRDAHKNNSENENYNYNEEISHEECPKIKLKYSEETSNDCVSMKIEIPSNDMGDKENVMEPVLGNTSLKITGFSDGDTASCIKDKEEKISPAGERRSGQETIYLHIEDTSHQRMLKMYICDCEALEDHEIKEIDIMQSSVKNYSNTDIVKTDFYECRECKKIYSVLGGVRFHSNKKFSLLCNMNKKSHKNGTCRGIKKYVCQICNHVFQNYNDFMQHNRAHHSVRKYVCRMCEKSFFMLRDLNTHISGAHKAIKEFKCGECPRAYVSLYLLRNHINMTHNKIRNCVCENCGKMCFSNKELYDHRIRAHGNGTYKCQECSRVCNSASALKKHVKVVHEGIRKYAKCDKCDKMFSSSDHRKRHIETVHRGIKKFKCPSCDKTFTQSSNMKIHISGVHFGIKKYECDLCFKTFLHFRDLKIHKNTTHYGIKSYVCQECQKRYSCKTYLKKHIESVHI